MGLARSPGKDRMKTPQFECQECGQKFFSAKAADLAAFGEEGCPGCGGTDIDLYVTGPLDTSRHDATVYAHGCGYSD